MMVWTIGHLISLKGIQNLEVLTQIQNDDHVGGGGTLL